MPDDGQGSITGWIAGMKSGDPAAAQPAVGALFRRMVELARRGYGLRDERDVMPPATRKMPRSCLRQPVHGPGQGTISATGRPRRPLAAACRHHHPQGPGPARHRMRQKRGGGHVHAATDIQEPDSDDDLLAQAIGSEPTPEFAAMVADEYRRLLERLGDDVLRKVAVLRVEGYTTDAIADQLGWPDGPSRDNWPYPPDSGVGCRRGLGLSWLRLAGKPARVERFSRDRDSPRVVRHRRPACFKPVVTLTLCSPGSG